MPSSALQLLITPTATAGSASATSPTRPRIACTQTLREALDVLTECGRGFDRGSVLTELSRAELLQGDADTAADMAERSLTELGPEAVLERARSETALAAALAAQGRREESGELFARAAATLGGLNASRQAARAWAELGNTLVAAGDTVRAVEAFQGTVPSVPRAQPKPVIGSRSPEGSRQDHGRRPPPSVPYRVTDRHGTARGTAAVSPERRPRDHLATPGTVVASVEPRNRTPTTAYGSQLVPVLLRLRRWRDEERHSVIRQLEVRARLTGVAGVGAPGGHTD